MPRHARLARRRAVATTAVAAAVTALAAGPTFLAAQQPTRPDSAAPRDTVTRLRAVEVRASASGRGRTRNANAIDSTLLRRAPAGSSALKLTQNVPGVNFQSADAFGMYEWSNRVTIRGFQTQQIGQTLDGLPLGDMSYGNFNGLGIGRAVDPENLADATVTQGSGALATASSNNLGGAIQYTTADAPNAAGVNLRQLAGASGALRTFVRANSGLHFFGTNSAVKGFVSASRTGSDKWKGGGARFSPSLGDLIGDRSFLGSRPENWQDQVNAKAQALLGRHQITAYYDFSSKKESDYTDLSLARYRQSGRDWDQYGTWADAQAGATSAAPDEAYFYSAQGARKDHLAYVRGDVRLGSVAHLTVTPYYHRHEGAGDWHAPNYGDTAVSPDPIMFRQSQYENDRAGATAQLRTVVGRNNVEAGVWYEHNDVTNRRPRWRLADYGSGPRVNFDDLLRLDYDRTGKIQTTTVYLQNTSTLFDERLRLTYGAKYLYISADFQSNGNTLGAPRFGDAGRPDLSVNTDGGVLPQAGAVYALTSSEELFGNFAVNVNAYPYSPAGGIYATNPATFDFFKRTAEPEKAYTYELGVRTKRSAVEASLAAYSIDYRNRLLGIAVCPPTQTCAASFGNVGGVTSRGVEALVILSPLRAVQWTSSASYNRATYDDDYTTGTATVGTAGKTVVDAPRVIANSALRLAAGGAFAGVGGRYVGKRFFTYTNDMSVPSYALAEANAGYTFGRLSALKDVSLQLNVQNLFDRDYISTLGSNGFTARGDNQTLLAGPRRLVFVTVGTRF